MPVLAGAQQSPIAVECAQEKLGVVPRNLEIIGPLEMARGLGKAAQHQAVPGGENLLVAPRPGAFFARGKERGTPTPERLREFLFTDSSVLSNYRSFLHNMQDILALEVATLAHIVVEHKEAGGTVGGEAPRLPRRPPGEQVPHSPRLAGLVG